MENTYIIPDRRVYSAVYPQFLADTQDIVIMLVPAEEGGKKLEFREALKRELSKEFHFIYYPYRRRVHLLEGITLPTGREYEEGRGQRCIKRIRCFFEFQGRLYYAVTACWQSFNKAVSMAAEYHTLEEDDVSFFRRRERDF